MKILSSILPPHHRPTLEEVEAAREQRANGIRGVIGVTTLILLVLVSFLVSTLVLQPLLEIASLKREREQALVLLHQAEKDEQEARNHYNWMHDPEYFEQIAREGANQAKPGETVILFSVPEKEKKS